MKGKRLLILGAAFALGLSACANSATMVRKTPFKASGDEKTSFATAAGDFDANVEYASYKGGGTSNPAINNNQIRLYQTTSTNAGGMLVVKAKGTAKLTSVTVGSSMATTLGYSVGNEYTAATPKSSFTEFGNISANGTKELSDLDTTVVTFACLGTTSSTRWYVNYLSVTYTGGGSSQLTYSVVYDGNGATSGSVPTDATAYNPGGTVTVLGNTGNLAKTNHTFGGWSHPNKDVYQSGGTFVINTNVTLTAIWNEVMDSNADLLNRELTGVEGNNYVNWSGKSGTSGAMYAGNSAGNYDSIQLRNSSDHKDSGIITTTSGGNAAKVGVIWENHTDNGRVLNVYGKNTPYSAVTDLYDNESCGTLIGTIVRGTSSSLIINDSYRYVGICSAANTSYLTSIHITWEEAPLDPQVNLNQDSVVLKTNQTSGVMVAATVQDVENPTFSWTSNNNNVLLENADTSIVTIKPNTNVEATSIVTLTVGGVTPNLTASVNVTINLPGPGESAGTAYTVEEAINAIENADGYAISEVYIKGVISQIDEYISKYSSITYWISDDGTTSNQFQVYSGKGINGANFNSISDIEIGASVVVVGGVKKYTPSSGDPIYEFNYNSELVSYKAPSHPASYYVEKGDSFAALTAHENKTGESGLIVSKTISEIASENNLAISADQNITCHKSLPLDSNITVSTTGEDNCGSIWGTSPNNDWRLYQNKGGDVIVTASNGYKLSSVKFVFTNGNNGTLLYNGNAISSDSVVNLSGNSATFTVSRTGTGTNGQIKISSIEVVYGDYTFESVDSVQLRFGASFAEADWNAILDDENLEIEEYGVKLFTSSSSSFATATPVQDAIEAGKTPASLSKAYSTPLEVENGMIKFVSIINIKAESAYGTIFCAAPFVRINGKDYFLDEKQYSVNSLAQELLNNEDYSSLSQDALNVLAGN